MKSDSICLILAAVTGDRNIRRSVDAFVREAESVGAQILVMDGTSSRLGFPGCDGLQVIPCGSSLLVPELWAIGLAACESRWAVLSTTTMEPAPGWLKHLVELNARTRASGVGSRIVPATDLSHWGRAVYLARYSRYLDPAQSDEPAGENVLYDRLELESVRSLWSEGFWEAEVNQYLRLTGRRFATEGGPGLRFLGGSSSWEMLIRRYLHGFRYGSTRGLGRLGRLQALAMPFVPLILARRAITRSMRLRGYGPSVWGLWLVLTLFWALGECLGIIFRSSPRERSDLVVGSLGTESA